MLFSSRFYIWNCGCPCCASSDLGVQFSTWNMFCRLCSAPSHSNALIKVSLACPPLKHTGHRHSTYTSQEARTFSAARFEWKPNRGVSSLSHSHPLLLFNPTLQHHPLLPIPTRTILVVWLVLAPLPLVHLNESPLQCLLWCQIKSSFPLLINLPKSPSFWMNSLLVVFPDNMHTMKGSGSQSEWAH